MSVRIPPSHRLPGVPSAPNTAWGPHVCPPAPGSSGCMRSVHHAELLQMNGFLSHHCCFAERTSACCSMVQWERDTWLLGDGAASWAGLGYEVGLSVQKASLPPVLPACCCWLLLGRDLQLEEPLLDFVASLCCQPYIQSKLQAGAVI